MGYAWKLVLKKPIQKNVVFWATDGRVSLMISAAWSLPWNFRQPRGLLKRYLRGLTYVKVRNKCIRKLLASRQGVEDQVFQRSDFASRSGNVDKLLSFARSGILRALLEQILKYVGDTEDCVAVL